MEVAWQPSRLSPNSTRERMEPRPKGNYHGNGQPGMPIWTPDKSGGQFLLIVIDVSTGFSTELQSVAYNCNSFAEILLESLQLNSSPARSLNDHESALTKKVLRDPFGKKVHECCNQRVSAEELAAHTCNFRPPYHFKSTSFAWLRVPI